MLVVALAVATRADQRRGGRSVRHGRCGQRPRWLAEVLAVQSGGADGPSKLPEVADNEVLSADDKAATPELNRFQRAAETIKKNGHPADCPALLRFQEQAAKAVEGDEESNRLMTELWMQVRLAMVTRMKDTADGQQAYDYETNMLMLGTEAAHFHDNGKLTDKAKAAFFVQLRNTPRRAPPNQYP